MKLDKFTSATDNWPFGPEIRVTQNHFSNSGIVRTLALPVVRTIVHIHMDEGEVAWPIDRERVDEPIEACE